MNQAKTTKLVTRYESGMLSAAEVANSLLYDLLSEPGIDKAFLSSIESLPDEVRREFLRLLQTIREADFHWTPFLLTAPATPSNSSASSAKLREICALLG